MPDAAALAATALDLVGRDPRGAVAAADAAIEVALAGSDRAAASKGHRAAGLALRELGDLPAAEARVRAAIRVAAGAPATATVSSRQAQAAAEARMSLAFILLDRGRLRTALGLADRAVGALDGLPAVRLAAQRALILQRTGRLDEALAGYAEAVPALRRAGDTLWEARALNNRGLLHAHAGTLEPAEADLVRAGRLYTGLGLHRFAADTEWNLATVATRRGDAPAALARFDRAEAAHLRDGTPRPQLLLNRCQVLLSVGLTAEARLVAARAVEQLRATGHEADLAEARLILAEAATADGQTELALAQARAARAAFTRQGRDGWTLLARLVALRAAENATSPRQRAGLARAAIRCAQELAAAGWQTASRDARLVAARAALDRGARTVAGEQLRLARPGLGAAPLELRVRWWHAEGLRRRAAGDRRGALAALRAGLGQLERAQAVLGATEMRVHVSAFGVDLAAAGIDLAVASGDPRQVLAWAERWRSRALRLRPVRPPNDPELADALAELRRLTADADAGEPAAGRAAAAARAGAEQRVVRISRTAGGALHGPAGPPPDPHELAAALGQADLGQAALGRADLGQAALGQATLGQADLGQAALGQATLGQADLGQATLGPAALVEFVRHGPRLLAVTLVDDRCRLHEIGQPAAVATSVQAAHFALRRLALAFGQPGGLDRIRAVALDAGRRLERLLIDPVRAAVGDRPLVLVPTGDLHAVPWGLLPGLAGRPVTVAPSAAAWLRASRTAGAATGHRLFVAGPDLPAARAEVLALSRGATRLLGRRATAPAVLAAMDGARMAHIAAHGLLRADNPLLSALALADGPLTVYDLERLTTAPATVVLPACQSGVTAVRAGDELLGLASALLALGTRSVVATVLPVADAGTEPLMRRLHGLLGRGASPASALATARGATDAADHQAFAAAASFVCLGA